MPQKLLFEVAEYLVELGGYTFEGIKNVRVEMLGHGPSIAFSDDLCRLVVR
jgi:hypothetical protein